MTLMTSHPADVRAGRREWIALAVLALPLLLVSMDVSVLYFAVPAITRTPSPVKRATESFGAIAAITSCTWR